MTATPAAMLSAGDRRCTFCPSISISPASIRWAPASDLIRVDLPAPFSPIMPRTSPRARYKSALLSAGLESKDLLIPRIRKSIDKSYRKKSCRSLLCVAPKSIRFGFVRVDGGLVEKHVGIIDVRIDGFAF